MDAETGKPLVDVILDQAGAKGTGAWTVQTALDLGVPVSGIAEATFARSLSSHPEQRAVSRDLPGPSTGSGTVHRVDDADAFIEDVRLALFASKIVAYSQGFDEIRAGAAEYDWSIDLGAVSKIWRGGCIIRAQFLNRIADAYAETPDLPVLLTAPYFVEALGRAQDAWRRIVATAAAAGIPAPAFSSSLVVLRRPARRPPARRPRAGPARLLRSAHLQAHRQARHLPHPVVGRPHRDRSRRHALSAVRVVQPSAQAGRTLWMRLKQVLRVPVPLHLRRGAPWSRADTSARRARHPSTG